MGEIMQKQARQQTALIACHIFVLLCGCSLADTSPTESSSTTLETSDPILDAISISTVDNLILLDSFNGNHGRVLSLDLTSDGAWLAYSGQDRTVTLWEIGERRVDRTFTLRSVDMADLVISPNDQLLATGEAIWDLETGQEVLILERGSSLPAYVDFSPDGSMLAVGLLESEITLWDIASGSPRVSLPQEQDNRTKTLVFSADGSLLAVGIIDGSIRIYDVEQAEMVNLFHHPSETDIHDLAMSSDGKYLAAGGRFPAVILWDLHTGEVIRTYGVHDDIYSVAISPDGTILAAGGGYEGAVLLWDLESGRLLRTLPMENKSMALAFSADGRVLVAGDFDGQIYIWGISTDQP